ncbi:MAG: hypothetical protein WCI74_08210 [Actinomycetes bacterium]
MAELFAATVPFRMVTVCTMNICRSPALEVVLARQLPWSSLAQGSVDISSAGTHAFAGATSCDISMAMVGVGEHLGVSAQVTPELLAGVDLVLCADRSHCASVVGMVQGISTRCFTARGAARLAQWVVDGGALSVAQQKASGAVVVADREHPETLAEPLPNEPVARLRWLVVEMDAGRGLAPIDQTALQMPFGHDDIPDPHVVGFNMHAMSAELILDAVDVFTSVVGRVLSVPIS